MPPPKTTIACLPVAGPDNPYQNLMMAGLNEDGRLRAFNGVDDRFWGIARTVISHRPQYLHFDWIVSYYFRRRRWFTYVSVAFFCAQVLLARGLGVRLVWTLHNILPHDAAEVGIHRFCQRFLARRCAWIRVFSEGTVASAATELGIPESRLRVVPEGSYTAVYPNRVSQSQARQYLGLPAETRVILYLGLIRQYKGVLELMCAFNKVKNGQTRLLIAGKVMDRAYGALLRSALSQDIALTDEFIPDDRLQYYFNAADAVVLPFRQIENSGSVIMAMGFAKTVVAPRIGVVKDRLRQQDEWLYDQPQQLPALLKKLIAAPAHALKATGTRNFEALQRHRWSDFARLFL